MKAIIFGSEKTPYSSGAYFDIYFWNNYPNSPPNVVITSTGNSTIIFNPNLYSTGKVSLSLLGNWRGSKGENLDSKISTILFFSSFGKKGDSLLSKSSISILFFGFLFRLLFLYKIINQQLLASNIYLF